MQCVSSIANCCQLQKGAFAAGLALSCWSLAGVARPRGVRAPKGCLTLALCIQALRSEVDAAVMSPALVALGRWQKRWCLAETGHVQPRQGVLSGLPASHPGRERFFHGGGRQRWWGLPAWPSCGAGHRAAFCSAPAAVPGGELLLEQVGPSLLHAPALGAGSERGGCAAAPQPGLRSPPGLCSGCLCPLPTGRDTFPPQGLLCLFCCRWEEVTPKMGCPATPACSTTMSHFRHSPAHSLTSTGSKTRTAVRQLCTRARFRLACPGGDSGPRFGPALCRSSLGGRWVLLQAGCFLVASAGQFLP